MSFYLVCVAALCLGVSAGLASRDPNQPPAGATPPKAAYPASADLIDYSRPARYDQSPSQKVAQAAAADPRSGAGSAPAREDPQQLAASKQAQQKHTSAAGQPKEPEGALKQTGAGCPLAYPCPPPPHAGGFNPHHGGVGGLVSSSWGRGLEYEGRPGHHGAGVVGSVLESSLSGPYRHGAHLAANVANIGHGGMHREYEDMVDYERYKLGQGRVAHDISRLDNGLHKLEYDLVQGAGHHLPSAAGKWAHHDAEYLVRDTRPGRELYDFGEYVAHDTRFGRELGYDKELLAKAMYNGYHGWSDFEVLMSLCPVSLRHLCASTIEQASVVAPYEVQRVVRKIRADPQARTRNKGRLSKLMADLKFRLDETGYVGAGIGAGGYTKYDKFSSHGYQPGYGSRHNTFAFGFDEEGYSPRFNKVSRHAMSYGYPYPPGFKGTALDKAQGTSEAEESS